MPDSHQQDLGRRTVWVLHHEELDILPLQGVVLVKIPRRLDQGSRPRTGGSHHFSQRVQLEHTPHRGKGERAPCEEMIRCEQ